VEAEALRVDEVRGGHILHCVSHDEDRDDRVRLVLRESPPRRATKPSFSFLTAFLSSVSTTLTSRLAAAP
jgi:hypothetical protein